MLSVGGDVGKLEIYQQFFSVWNPLREVLKTKPNIFFIPV